MTVRFEPWSNALSPLTSPTRTALHWRSFTFSVLQLVSKYQEDEGSLSYHPFWGYDLILGKTGYLSFSSPPDPWCRSSIPAKYGWKDQVSLPLSSQPHIPLIKQIYPKCIRMRIKRPHWSLPQTVYNVEVSCWNNHTEKTRNCHPHQWPLIDWRCHFRKIETFPKF